MASQHQDQHPRQFAKIGAETLKVSLRQLNQCPIFNNKFHLIALLGESEKAKVYLAQDIKNPSERYVIKILTSASQLKDYESLMKLNHHGVVKVLELSRRGFIVKPK